MPKDCNFAFEFRFLPDDDPAALFQEIEAYARQAIEPDMHAVSRDTGIRFTVTSQSPGLDTEDGAEVTTLAKALSQSNASGKVSFGTEAGLFQQAGIPTVVCGPGSIEQAHKPNEWVSLAQVALCEAFLQRLADRASAPI